MDGSMLIATLISDGSDSLTENIQTPSCIINATTAYTTSPRANCAATCRQNALVPDETFRAMASSNSSELVLIVSPSIVRTEVGPTSGPRIVESRTD